MYAYRADIPRISPACTPTTLVSVGPRRFNWRGDWDRGGFQLNAITDQASILNSFITNPNENAVNSRRAKDTSNYNVVTPGRKF